MSRLPSTRRPPPGPGPGVTRRLFVVGAASSTALLVTLGSGCEDPVPFVVEVGQLVPGAVEIAAHVADDEKKALLKGVRRTIAAASPAPTTPDGVLVVLREAARADYAAGRCSQVAGWRLSRTELGLALLLARDA